MSILYVGDNTKPAEVLFRRALIRALSKHCEVSFIAKVLNISERSCYRELQGYRRRGKKDNATA